MLHIDTWSFKNIILRIILNLQVSYNYLIHSVYYLQASVLKYLRARVLIIININCIVSNIKIFFQCGNTFYNIAHEQHRIYMYKNVFKDFLQSIERYGFWSSSCCSRCFGLMWSLLAKESPSECTSVSQDFPSQSTVYISEELSE